MTGKVAFVFLLTIATLFSAFFAAPAALEYKNFLPIDPKNFFKCMIPCDQCQDDPICATDGKTYGCPNALTCYKMCGKKIEIDYFGNCTDAGYNPSIDPPYMQLRFKYL